MTPIISVTTDNIVNVYQKVRKLLQGNDQVIFDSYCTVAQKMGFPFNGPENPNEFQDKHDEIISEFGAGDFLSSSEKAMMLFGEIGTRVLEDEVVNIDFNSYIDIIVFPTNKEHITLFLNPSLYWTIRWEKDNFLLVLYDKDMDEIVPSYVVEYVFSSIVTFQQELYTVASALISVVVEAALRDMLDPHGYKYVKGGSKEDVYKLSEAQLEVDGNKYVLTYNDPMPKTTNDFTTSTNGAAKVNLRIRRIIKRRKNKVCTDLQVILDECLIDHLSVNDKEQEAVFSVDGLGTALDLARNKLGILSATDLPLNFDEVIKLLRNSLIHLSKDALDAILPGFKPPNNTLDSFLRDRNKVGSLIRYVCNFANKKYIQLKNATP